MKTKYTENILLENGYIIFIGRRFKLITRKFYMMYFVLSFNATP